LRVTILYAGAAFAFIIRNLNANFQLLLVRIIAILARPSCYNNRSAPAVTGQIDSMIGLCMFECNTLQQQRQRASEVYCREKKAALHGDASNRSLIAANDGHSLTQL